jgi:hypothetical protein
VTVGRKVRFTPNGLSVISRQRAISCASSSGVRLREAGDDAQAAGVGHGRRHLGEADEVHAALDDGVLDAEQFGDAGLHEGLPWWMRMGGVERMRAAEGRKRR